MTKPASPPTTAGIQPAALNRLLMATAIGARAPNTKQSASATLTAGMKSLVELQRVGSQPPDNDQEQGAGRSSSVCGAFIMSGRLKLTSVFVNQAPESLPPAHPTCAHGHLGACGRLQLA
jgi:hypothetical protein